VSAATYREEAKTNIKQSSGAATLTVAAAKTPHKSDVLTIVADTIILNAKIMNLKHSTHQQHKKCIFFKHFCKI